MTYQIIDRHTGRLVGTYTNKTRAYNRADKLDLEYGAVRYSVRRVEAA